MSHVERAIACTKHIMSKLGRSEDDITPEETLAEALRTENEREIVPGFSPAQLALGRAPDELGRFVDPSAREAPDVLCENPDGEFQRNNERMKHSSRSGVRVEGSEQGPCSQHQARCFHWSVQSFGYRNSVNRRWRTEANVVSMVGSGK